jgi:hypothetical protein
LARTKHLAYTLEDISVNPPRRRALLGAVGLVASGLGAGCLQAALDPGTGSTTDSEVGPTVDSRAGTTADPETASRESTDNSTEQTTSLRVRTDDLFLANERGDDHRLDVRVTRSTDDGDGDGERHLYRRYEIPAGSTLEIPDLGIVGRRYVVELRPPGGEWRRFEWAVLDCSKWATPTQEPRTPEDDPTLNTDALVRMRDDEFEFYRNECDALAFSVDVGLPADEHVAKEYASNTTTG